jgi:hypothetical protein
MSWLKPLQRPQEKSGAQLYLCEGATLDAPGTARGLLGSLAEPNPMALEADPLPAPSGGCSSALVADDHGLLHQLLREAASRKPPSTETTQSGRLWRFWPMDDALADKALRILNESPARLLTIGAPGQLCAAFPLSEPGLRLNGMHRAIRGVETFREDTFLTLVRTYASIHELSSPLSDATQIAQAREQLLSLSPGHHAVLWVLPDRRGKILRFRQGLDLAHIPAVPKNPTLRSLDLALLEALVLRTVLGIQKPEEANHPQVIPVDSVDSLVEKVQRGEYQTGFVMNPPPTWEIRAVMEAAQQLPPRTLELSSLGPSGPP